MSKFTTVVTLLLASLFFVCSANATVELPPVKTQIVNADKAVFIGSLTVTNVGGTVWEKVVADADPLVIGFSTKTKCEAFKTAFKTWNFAPGELSNVLVAAGNSGQVTAVANSWKANGYAVLVGDCYDK